MSSWDVLSILLSSTADEGQLGPPESLSGLSHGRHSTRTEQREKLWVTAH